MFERGVADSDHPIPKVPVTKQASLFDTYRNSLPFSLIEIILQRYGMKIFVSLSFTRWFISLNYSIYLVKYVIFTTICSHKF